MMSDVLKNLAEVRGTIGKCLDVDCISAVFFLLKSRRDSLSLVVHKLGCDRTTKPMNILQSEGTAMSPLRENFGKDLIATFVANKSPFNSNNMCCTLHCVASLLCGKKSIAKNAYLLAHHPSPPQKPFTLANLGLPRTKRHPKVGKTPIMHV